MLITHFVSQQPCLCFIKNIHNNILYTNKIIDILNIINSVIRKLEVTMSDFIDFITDKANDPATGKKLLVLLADKKMTKEKLQAWFKKEGYDITLQECQELIDKKGNFKGIGGIISNNNNVKY